ncbi:Cytochrome b/b6, N-terminal domain [Magnetococcus marinus MC-1]|uniref:Cytochrome b n=1 Tax=Magnetococcus marinus (strain ATCC BAA-1437 / JCM 17883 / MC-1) TaxID=156889 RepID=A0L4J0_MAGMM|nr:cytochrome b/b6 [Magnetococcus marinus]ABK42883.1 Cytochrome b/b6, N-terminal domain [Magnetococcus marinus MC-1]
MFKSLMGWVDERLPISEFMRTQAVEYPTPKNLNYWWNFGSLALLVLIIQLATGIFLVMHYKPDALLAFDSVEHIMRDVNWGWLLRYMHANGATFFFVVIYIHILRGMYYGSYRAPREILWWIGVIIFFLLMGTGFIGYVLVWGQMSYWGAVVITKLITAIPLIGEGLVVWVWGGFSVGDPTLNRFFSLHYLLPFVLVGLVVLHIWALHAVHSNNPDGIDLEEKDTIPFHPYFTIKDFFGYGVALTIYCYFVFFAPNAFLEPDNYIPANPMQTPPHIVPEWYFLPFYAILRSIDFLGPYSKLAGVVAMVAAIAILFVLPFLDRSPVRSFRYRGISKGLFWIFVVDCFVLGWVGFSPADRMVFGLPIVYIGRTATAVYFGYFFLLWLVTALNIEKPKPVPKSL